MKHINIPVFVPHMGCPNKCVFCDQRAISGVRVFKREEAVRTVEEHLATAPADAEIEIVEIHHDRKVDAPSGTALAIADAIRQIRPESTVHSGRSGMGKRTPEEIGIHAVRMGNVVGIHEVMIGTQNQTITLKHEAHSRALFAEGALAAADFLMGKPAGLYDMNSLLDG